jgi:hypothetical protein
LEGRAAKVVCATVVAAAAMALASSADAATLHQGRFVSVCDFSHESKNDPIVFPRQRGAAHLHHFFGNRSTNHRSTAKKLRRKKRRTTCRPETDRSAYWVPALIVRGKVIEPTSVRAYYSSHGKNPRSIHAFPPGLKVIAGSAMATAPQPHGIVTWNCYSGYLSDVGGTVGEPNCPGGGKLILSIAFPDCWDGVSLDSPDHQSHLAYAEKDWVLSPYSTCPPTHPVALPTLFMRVIYPTSGAPTGAELASGGIHSGHADFINAWDQAVLENLVADCIRRARDCRNRG